MVKLKRRTEGKQVGTLYHVCSMQSLIYNLDHNAIIPGEAANKIKGKKTISFTRNKGYVVDTISPLNPFFFQFVIDGNKLSDSVKIEPYAAVGYRDSAQSEAEEIVFGTVKDLKKYLKGLNIYCDVDALDVRPNPPQMLLDALNKIKSSGISNVAVFPVRGRDVGSHALLRPAKYNMPKDLDSLISDIEQAIKDKKPMIDTKGEWNAEA